MTDKKIMSQEDKAALIGSIDTAFALTKEMLDEISENLKCDDDVKFGVNLYLATMLIRTIRDTVNSVKEKTSPEAENVKISE